MIFTSSSPNVSDSYQSSQRESRNTLTRYNANKMRILVDTWVQSNAHAQITLGIRQLCYPNTVMNLNIETTLITASVHQSTARIGSQTHFRDAVSSQRYFNVQQWNKGMFQFQWDSMDITNRKTLVD